MYDPTEEDFYYWHQTSGEVQWERPENYKLAADDAMMSSVIKIQSMYRAKHAKTYVAGKAEEKKAAVTEGWAEVADAAAGCNYFWNKTTGEAVWELPEGVDPSTVERLEGTVFTVSNTEKLRDILRTARCVHIILRHDGYNIMTE